MRTLIKSFVSFKIKIEMKIKTETGFNERYLKGINEPLRIFNESAKKRKMKFTAILI